MRDYKNNLMNWRIKMINLSKDSAKIKKQLEELQDKNLDDVIRKNYLKLRIHRFIIWSIIIGFVIFIISIPQIFKSAENEKDEEIYRGNHKNAFYISQEFVKNHLNSPSTAEFPSWYDQTSNVIQKPGSFTQYTINSYVDAQNTFGAMIREYYVCEVEYIKARDTWRLIDFKFK